MTTQRSRQLRQSLTDAEKALWRRLRRRQLLDCKFRRQHPQRPYVLDFYCHEAALVVELDGDQHKVDARQVAWDKRRTAVLEARGLKVLRYSNRQVLLETDGVLADIRWVLVERLKERNG